MDKARRTLAQVTLVLCVAASGGVLLASLVGFLGSWWWVFDLFANFRLQYLVLGLAATVGLALGRRWLLTSLSSLPILINLVLIVPLYIGGPATGEKVASLLLWNVNYHNERIEEVISHIAETDADVAAVLELTAPLSEAIRSAFPEHQWLATPRDDAFGIGVLVRGQVVSQRVLGLSGEALPAHEVVLSTRSGPITILAVHTLPPVRREYAKQRDQMMVEIGEWANQVQGPVVVIGDLNATSWSASFRKLIGESRLRDSQRGFGLSATWPRQLTPLSISIDHLLHSGELAASVRRTGPFVGSDHRSLYVELVSR